jgi:hypothetical protein
MTTTTANGFSQVTQENLTATTTQGAQNDNYRSALTPSLTLPLSGGGNNRDFREAF